MTRQTDNRTREYLIYPLYITKTLLIGFYLISEFTKMQLYQEKFLDVG